VRGRRTHPGRAARIRQLAGCPLSLCLQPQSSWHRGSRHQDREWRKATARSWDSWARTKRHHRDPVLARPRLRHASRTTTPRGPLPSPTQGASDLPDPGWRSPDPYCPDPYCPDPYCPDLDAPDWHCRDLGDPDPYGLDPQAGLAPTDRADRAPSGSGKTYGLARTIRQVPPHPPARRSSTSALPFAPCRAPSETTILA
jgi:hypothetical protein